MASKSCGINKIDIMNNNNYLDFFSVRVQKHEHARLGKRVIPPQFVQKCLKLVAQYYSNELANSNHYYQTTIDS